jgi:hypothetical protein
LFRSCASIIRPNTLSKCASRLCKNSLSDRSEPVGAGLVLPAAAADCRSRVPFCGLHVTPCTAHCSQMSSPGLSTHRTLRRRHSAQLLVPRRMRFEGGAVADESAAEAELDIVRSAESGHAIWKHSGFFREAWTVAAMSPSSSEEMVWRLRGFRTEEPM